MYWLYAWTVTPLLAYAVSGWNLTATSVPVLSKENVPIPVVLPCVKKYDCEIFWVVWSTTTHRLWIAAVTPAPTFIIDDKLIFGQDRLHFVKKIINS